MQNLSILKKQDDHERLEQWRHYKHHKQQLKFSQARTPFKAVAFENNFVLPSLRY